MDGFKRHPDMHCVNTHYADSLKNVIESSFFSNPWFTSEFIINSISSIGESLTEDRIVKWLSAYPELKGKSASAKNIGVIMAGNIPMVGFHDFITVLLSGNCLTAHLSSRDNKLMPLFSAVLQHFAPEFKNYIFFEDNLQNQIDALIATGSDNSARYFEYYFAKYPHIIRKNRNSAAILNGRESSEDLKKLADDIFLYFGLGCRNVSKVYLPENYDIPGLMKHFDRYSFLYNHNKYANNYDYQRAVFLLNAFPHYDNGFLLVRESDLFSSPVACLHYEKYNNINELASEIKAHKDILQCVVTNEECIEQRIEFGNSQKPMLWEYADNVDTMKFLISLGQA